MLGGDSYIRKAKAVAVALVGLCALTTERVEAAVGDTRFVIADATIRRSPSATEALSASLDLLIEVEGAASTQAIGWASLIRVTPLAGSVGEVRFDPPPAVGEDPNVPPAGVNAYTDFDRDFSGALYGQTTDGADLSLVATYFEPSIVTPPALDADGNLTVPSGVGLASIPLSISPDATGDFLLEFDTDPLLTGVLYATGLPSPDDLATHPVGAHASAVISVAADLGVGDFTGDGLVDAADYTVWRDNLGTLSGALGPDGDGDGDGDVDQDDYLVWTSTYGQSLVGAASATPEPTAAVTLLIGMLFSPQRKRTY